MKTTEKQIKEIANKLYDLAAGHYQRNLIAGLETWSGSSLRGKARNWGGRYAESRENFLDRMRANGLTVGVPLVERGTPKRWQRRLVVEINEKLYDVVDEIEITGRMKYHYHDEPIEAKFFLA